MLAEFSINPTSGPHVGEDIAKVIEILESSGVEYQLGPMGTTIEGDVKQVLTTIGLCHSMIAGKHPRVITTIVLDDCHDRQQTLSGAIARVESHLGHAARH